MITAIEDARGRAPDHELLERARELRRLTFTQDIRFYALAQKWQSQGRQFAGLLFAHPLGITIGQIVNDLELVAKASDPSDWENQTDRLPFT